MLRTSRDLTLIKPTMLRRGFDHLEQIHVTHQAFIVVMLLVGLFVESIIGAVA
ncbi:MAG: hypothetical protein ACI9FJ_000012 [Alteromonadaceae bacterium]|jgi:hypothetical protein